MSTQMSHLVDIERQNLLLYPIASELERVKQAFSLVPVSLVGDVVMYVLS